MNKCPYCTERYKESSDILAHLQEEHEEMIPKGFTTDQLAYFIKTGKTHGNCIMCKNKTMWKEATGKYNRLCTNPKCKEQYAEMFSKRMVGKYGKTTLLNDPEHQKKMLSNRSISGTYKWSDGKEIGYTGTYEMDFLRFLDQFLGFGSDDIMSPSPHTYYYIYEGKKHFYIPDFFIPSLNLEIEIKAGGKNENMHHKIQAVDRVKEKLKDAVLTSQKEFGYIKVYDKEYDNFIDLLMQMKQTDKPLFYTRDWNAVHEQALTEEETIIESAVTTLINDTDVLEAQLESLVNNADSHIQNELMITLENQLHFYSSKELLLSSIHLFDAEHPNVHDAYDLSMQHKFGIYHPGFIDNETASFMLDLLKKWDTAEFRSNITSKALAKDVCKENFIRDIQVSQYILQESYKRYPEHQSTIIENYCWLETVVREQSLTIGGEKKYPVYVLLTHTGTILSNAIKAVTMKEFSHCSISLDPELNNMYSFGRKYKSNPLIGRFVREDIRGGLFEDVSETAAYALYVTFVTKDEYERIQERLKFFQDNADSFVYNFTGLITHALGKENSRSLAFFCSQFVDMVLSSAKPYFDRHSSLVKPTDYEEHEEFHFISKGLLKNYDASFTKRKTQLIASNIKQVRKKEEPYKLVYIPLTDEEIRAKVIELPLDRVGCVTSYAALKQWVKDTHADVRYYMVIPMKEIQEVIVGLYDGIVYIQGPGRIAITNKNLL